MPGEKSLRKIRAYADTSVFGGTRDDQFADPSNAFFDRVRSGEFIILLSTLTLRELVEAPVEVRNVWEDLTPEAVEEIPVGPEVEELAAIYISEGVLGQASEADALHVAAATVAGADLILSWNFRHIVNYNRIRGFNAVNIRNGYRSMMILSPMEVSDGDRDEDI